MAMPFELVRVLHKMEGEVVEAAKQVIQQQQHNPEAPRSQFKLGVASAQQAEDLRTLQAFLAYQASREDKVWGHHHGDALFVQRAWARLQQLIRTYENHVQRDARAAWQHTSGDDKQTLQRMVATLFFAHIERAFEIWKNKHVKDFYFSPRRQGESAPAQPGGECDGTALPASGTADVADDSARDTGV
jgi:hypothetical protein